MTRIARAPAPAESGARLAWAQRFVRTGLVSPLLWAAAAGLAGGVATIAFRACISGLVYLETGRVSGLVDAARALPAPLRILFPAVGGLAAGTVLWLERRRSGRDEGGDYMESIVIGDGVVPPGKSFSRSLSSLFSIASGGSIGREGPMVQLAATVASLIARAARMGVPQRRLLVACGAAAGITAAYNAPLAGALFVAEIVLGSIAVESLVPLIVAAMVANLTTHLLAPDVPLYPIHGLEHTAGIVYLSYAAIGVVTGVCGPLFLGLINATRHGVERIPVALPFKMMLGGLGVGLISVWMPEVWGNGYSVVNAVLAGQWVGAALVLLLACKIAATASTVGSGAIGGVFTPALVVGAALGALVSQTFTILLPGAAPQAQAGAAVAMAAFLAATTQAPLTSILMILEMTGAYGLVLPLMLACAVADLVVRTLGAKSIYSAAEHRRQRNAELRDLSSRSVASLLRPSPPAVRDDASIDDVVAAFAQTRFRYLYVVDANDRYRGAIPLYDLRQRLEGAEAATSVGDTASSLTTDLPPLREDMTLQQALARFQTHVGERLPVVDAANRLTGAVWKTDVLLELQERLGAAAR